MARILTGIQSTGTPHLGNILNLFYADRDGCIITVLETIHRYCFHWLCDFTLPLLSYPFISSAVEKEELQTVRFLELDDADPLFLSCETN